MIQNTTILDKLNKKTANNKVLNEFIIKLLENEADGKNYKKFFDSAIDEALKKKGDTDR